MLEIILRYIQVLKERRAVACDHLVATEESASRTLWAATIDFLDTIIAELEESVKAQNHLLIKNAGEAMVEAAKAAGLKDVQIEVGEWNAGYKRRQSTLASTGPALDTRDGKGDYTKK